MKVVICDGKISYTSDEDLIIHSFDGNMCFSAGSLTTWNASNTIYKDYENMVLPNALAEVVEVGFAKQEIKESTADKTKKVMALPISNSFSLGERVFLKVKTIGLTGKKLKVEVRQGIEKQLTDKDQKVEALSVAEMTVGKITQSEDAKNKYDASNLRALENIAMKEMTLEAKTDAEKRNWKEILTKTRDKKIKLYFHVEVLDADGEVKYDGDDANDPKNFSYKKPFELIDGKVCFCFNQGIVEKSCLGKGTAIPNKMYDEAAEELNIEKATMLAIAKQETHKSSFWKEGQATILYERHKMWKHLKEDLHKSKEELNVLNKKYPELVNPNQGGYGLFSAQYTKLEKAKKIDYDSAIKACSWGKFQVLGASYAGAFSSPRELEEAVNTCEIQQFRLFKGYLKNTNGMTKALRNHEWETVAKLYNGSSWKTINPDYAKNIKKYYGEFANKK
ncbi:N-acetylmuramidase domain-containing protein [Chryseobacterium sp. c4a]|uniref:N-acetylmuramidase domain-containing protein n=1 Tax=Chryseobacterium sp. c4a TaxID=1573582 RepID=UPI00135ABD60|nr:N-acetylmuramidase domain-containing protein [Chryseobacterium sp. c4a]